MENHVLIALIDSLINDAVSKIKVVEGDRGPRGLRGKDFDFESNREAIEEIIQKYLPTEVTLTVEQLEALQGKDGRDGKDGQSVSVEDVIPLITDTVLEAVKNYKHKFSDTELNSFKLKFSDLTEDEKEEIRGLKGLNGRDGHDFVFDEHKEEIKEILNNQILNNKESLKLKFEDLSEDEKFSLRGPRGQRGKSGQDFIFDEHREKIESIIISDIENKKEDLKLKFSDLTEDEKSSLKLKFDDLSDEDRLSLRGPRGQRGKQGIQGENGKDASTWLCGEGNPTEIKNAKTNDLYLDVSNGDIYKLGEVWGKIGNIRGLNGKDGLDGKDGKSIQGLPGIKGQDGENAPIIENVEINQWNKSEFSFIFEFSDGTSLETNRVIIPPSHVSNYYSTAYAGGGSGTANPTEYFDEGVSLGTSSKVDFVGSGVTSTLIGDTVVVNIPGGSSAANEIEVLDEGTSLGNVKKLNFVGPEFNANVVGDTATITHTPSSGGTGQDITVLDEGIVKTTHLKNINFVGNGVRVVTTSVMSDWDTLSGLVSMDDYVDADSDSVTVEIIQQDNSILTNIDCDASVYVGALVRMNNLGVAVNAIASSYATSNVVGIVEEKLSDTKCIIRVSGYSLPIYSGLDTSYDYFLSETVAGGITNIPPSSVGHVKLNVGQAFSATRFLFRKGERLVRA